MGSMAKKSSKKEKKRKKSERKDDSGRILFPSFCCVKNKSKKEKQRRLKRPRKLIKKPEIVSTEAKPDVKNKTLSVVKKKTSIKPRPSIKPPSVPCPPPIQQIKQQQPNYFPHRFPVPPPHCEPWLISKKPQIPKKFAAKSKEISSERAVEMNSKEKMKSKEKEREKRAKKRDHDLSRKAVKKSTSPENSVSDSIQIEKEKVNANANRKMPLNSENHPEQMITANKFTVQGRPVLSWKYADARPLNGPRPTLTDFLTEGIGKVRNPQIVKLPAEVPALKGPCTCVKCSFKTAMAALPIDC